MSAPSPVAERPELASVSNLRNGHGAQADSTPNATTLADTSGGWGPNLRRAFLAARGLGPRGSAVEADGAKLDAARSALESDLRLVWRASRHAVAAVVIALFPFLFILDKAVHWPMSPVVPGLGLLALGILLAPFAAMEVLGRILRGQQDPVARHRKARRLLHATKVAVVVALVWLAAWISLGV